MSKSHNIPAVENAQAEIDLLCLCAATTIDEPTAAAITSLAGDDIHWDNFLQLANRHRLIPLVYSTLNRVCRDVVPPGPFDTLRSRFNRNTKNNLRLLGELNRILATSAGNNIVAIPFKGLALAAAAYGNLSLREAGDLDLLVRRPDMPAIAAILRLAGYQPDSPRTPGEEQAMLDSKYCYHVGFANPQSGIVVEPHWAIMPRFYSAALDDWTAGLWDRLTTQNLFGTNVHAIAAEDLPILLAIHAGRHLWGQMNWLCDLAELIRAQPDLDWSRTIANADNIGQGRILRLGLSLAMDLLRARLKPEVAAAVRQDRVAAELAARAKSWLFRDPDAPDPGDFSRTRFIMRSMDWPRDRVSWVWHHVVTKF